MIPSSTLQPVVENAEGTAYVDRGGGEVSTLDQLDVRLDRTASRLCDLAGGIALQSNLTAMTSSGFTGAIMGRLDGVRAQGGGSKPTPPSHDGRMSLGAAEKANPAPLPTPARPLTLYTSGTVLAGKSSEMPGTSEMSGAAGFSYGASSGMIGLELRASRNLVLGTAASFTRLETDIDYGATADADVIHGAAYLSYATREWFFDALAAYGVIALDMTRPGDGETVHADTDASAAGLAARTGYLFEFDKVRVGPLAGLSYIHATVDGYTEMGDGVTMTVGDQSIDSLTGSAGIRLLAPFVSDGMVFVPYLNVTLEHRFGSDTSSVSTSLAPASNGGTTLSFPIFGARDYGKVEGGLTVELAPSTSVSVRGASTFARSDGHDYRLSAGFNYRF